MCLFGLILGLRRRQHRRAGLRISGGFGCGFGFNSFRTYRASVVGCVRLARSACEQVVEHDVSGSR